jgi:hypothetical protein
VASLQASGVPFAWNPVGAVVMSLPLALIFAAMAGGVWVTRDRSRARAR